MKKIYILLPILIIFGSLKVFSQEKDSLNISLKDAIRKGLENNFGIRISEKDMEISENNNTWGNAGLLPTVSLSASQINRFENAENTYSGNRQDTYLNSLSPGVNVSMNLFKGFYVKISKQNLEHLKSLSEGNLQLTVENTIADIVNAYNSVLLENEKLKVTKDLMQLSKDRYRYVLMKKELGLSVSYDVLQIKNAFLTDSSNYLLQLMTKESQMREFNKVLGDLKIYNYNLTDTLTIHDADFILGDMESQMYENNATLKTQSVNNLIVENNIKLAKSSLYPSLSLNTGADQTNSMYTIQSASTNSYTYGAYANLTFSYLIFNGNQRKRAIDNAKIDAEKARLNYDELKMILRNNLYNLFEMYAIRKQLLKVAQENFKAASLNLEISKEKFQTGIINSFNYRDIQLTYLNSAFALSQSKYNLITTYNDLLKITGKITAEYK